MVPVWNNICLHCWLQDETLDEDVLAEERRVRADDLPESTAVKIRNLNKTYPSKRKHYGIA